MSDRPEATVIVCTRNRPDLLRQSLAALEAREATTPHEIVVVDDGSNPPLRQEQVGGAKLIRREGEGRLTAARNAGIRAASGRILLFTDDDVEVRPEWLDAAVGFLDAHPEHVGVVGPIDSTPYDPLAGYSLQIDAPGDYYGANLAYRAEVVRELGGFDERIGTPAGDDVDFAFRALELGPIGWEPRMRILHHARSLSLLLLARRQRMAPTAVVVFRRHREHFGRARRLPAVLFPYCAIALVWLKLARKELPGVLLKPSRLARLLALPLLEVFYATAGLLESALMRRSPCRLARASR